jgi:hypothetical protein
MSCECKRERIAKLLIQKLTECCDDEVTLTHPKCDIEVQIAPPGVKEFWMNITLGEKSFGIEITPEGKMTVREFKCF